MRLNRLIIFLITTSILFSALSIKTVKAENDIENLVNAIFNIEMKSATDLEINVEITAYKLTIDKTYDYEEIKSASEQDLGSFRLLLYQMLEKQIENTFENAEITDLNRPAFDGEKFNEILNVTLDSSFFGLNENVNAQTLINGVIDMGAIVNYTISFQAEEGWNNTYLLDLGETLNFKHTTGALKEKTIEWKVRNWDGNEPSEVGELQLKVDNPTTLLSEENISLEFELNSENVDRPNLKTNIIVEDIDIRAYDSLPSFIYNLDFVPSDGLRLFIENGLISWNKSYETTIKPLEEKIKTTIEESSFNQTLDILFSWDKNTTTNCDTPYETKNMDSDPPVKAVLLDNDIDLRIFDISSKAFFGLINSGANANISKNDINFGDNLSDIGYKYTASLVLPDDLRLSGLNIYNWNESGSLSGQFNSDISVTYSQEEKETFVEIEIKSTDLNLLSFFTGKTELTFGLNLKENRNYNVTRIPDEFTIPEKILIDYLSSDAFRLCIKEKVFREEEISSFLKNENRVFENRIVTILPGLKIKGKADSTSFYDSINAWDGKISDMDKGPPIDVDLYASSTYPISFDFSFLPPSFNIPTQKLNFTAIPGQNVVYRMIFPDGISLKASDQLGKVKLEKMKDGREYIEIKFNGTDSNLTDIVSLEIIPSAFFIIGVFTPCIISLIIAIVLIIIIYIIRKKMKGRKRGEIEREPMGYEEEDYYVPPPPGTG
jgi:hypothetical protein